MNLDSDHLVTIMHGAICASVRADGPDLSARQLALLLIVGLDPGMHTVRGLAAQLNISKPAVSRSLDRLCDIGLAGRAPDPRDQRSVLVVLTAAGRGHLADLRGYLRDAARPSSPSRSTRMVATRHAPAMMSAG
jgi:DNA-binding MarR family transcriptional regulator